MEGVVGYRHILCKLRKRAYCIHKPGIPLAMLKKTTRESSCLDNSVRIVEGVKRVDKRKMEELGEEMGVIESFRREQMRSLLKRALVTNGM